MKLKNSLLSRALMLLLTLIVSTVSLAAIPTTANAAATEQCTYEVGSSDSSDCLTGDWNAFGGDWMGVYGVTAGAGSGSGSKALHVVNSGRNAAWGGATIWKSSLDEAISPGDQIVTVLVYNPFASSEVSLQLEDQNSAFKQTGYGCYCDAKLLYVTKTLTGTGWKTLNFNFGTSALDYTGTAASPLHTQNYNKMSIFFEKGIASPVNVTGYPNPDYEIQSLTFTLNNVVPIATVTTPATLVTFDSGDTSGYALSSYEWAKGNVNGAPGGASCPNNALQLEKPSGAGQYAGTKVLSLSGDKSIISSSTKVVTANVFTAKAGTVLTMTAMASDESTYVTKDATLSAGWQLVTFDFTTPTYSPNGDGYIRSNRYSKLNLSINGGTAGAGEVVFVDDIAFNGTSTPAIAISPCPIVIPKALGLIATPNISVSDGVVKCTVGTYTTPATDAVFYLYLNGQVISGKTTSAKANWMADWNFVPMSYKSASITSGATWPILKEWSDGKSSKLQCLVKAYADRGIDASRTSVETLAKVGRMVHQTALTDITMRLVEPAMTKTNGVPSNYVDFSYDPIQNNWAKYYGPNLGVYYKYFEAGSTFKVTYKVTNSKTGKPVTNRPVWLIVNKNYGGVQMASFTYSWNEETFAAAGHGTDVGETQIPGWTDGDGMVTFTLTNTNGDAVAEPKPAKLYEIQPASVTPLFSTITLTAHLGSDETHETKDIIWGHFTKK